MTIPITGDFLDQLIAKTPADKLVYTYDDVYWSMIVTAITSLVLVNGRYRVIQTVATTLVCSFTALTVFNVCALPYFNVDFAWSDVLEGLKFRLPETTPGGKSPVGTALATFGIIGVGAAELIAYPYWCLERGYARYTGPRDESDGWAKRANGWLNVLRWDAALSMVIYTFATIAFYFLGAVVLHPRGLNPEGYHMIATLAKMYDDVFHPWGHWVFLFGAISVLYATFFVGTAGNARIAGDAVYVFGFGKGTRDSKIWWTRLFSGLFPVISLMVYLVNKNPVQLVLISGLAQAVMLPMLGGAALYFRYKRCDHRITPGKLWDLMLWLSFVGLLIAGCWGAWSKFSPFVFG